MQTQTLTKTPVALTIAGSDSGGGAGIQADLRVFAARGVHGTSAITCTTAQNPDGVVSVEALSPEHVSDQCSQVLKYFNVGAIKTGMLFDRGIIEAVVNVLKNHPGIPLVVDPVMVATSGAKLLKDDAIEGITETLFPLATVITPNLDEAAVLLEKERVEGETMLEDCKALVSKYSTHVLMKGGHLTQESIVDLFVSTDLEVRTLHSARVDGVNSHGSGCSLASAIAAELAKGQALSEAIKNAHKYLQSAFKTPMLIGETHFLRHLI